MRIPKTFLCATAAVLLLATPIRADGDLSRVLPSPVPPPGTDLSHLRKNLFKKLFSEKYFKNATCREFANYSLLRNGLPAVGEAAPVRGTRLSTDRGNEEHDPPEFMDSILKPQKPYRSYKITAKGANGGWNVLVERETTLSGSPDRLRTATTYRFKLLDFENKGSCAIVDFQFRASHGNSAPLEETMTLDSCMDLFLADSHASRGLSPAALKMIEILREDCSLSMHYSLDAKKMLSRPVPIDW